MTEESSRLNEMYLRTMKEAKRDTALGRVRDLWWVDFERTVEECGAEYVLNRLDVFMSSRRSELDKLARAYGVEKGESNEETERQREAQFMKSNTGKMFERFAGLALAHCLREVDAPYSVLGFQKPNIGYCHGLTLDDFVVELKFGDGTLGTRIDSDLFAFNPTDRDAEFYMISVKTTLKDRFHNVPFWNLLRRAALSADYPEVQARNPDVLAKGKYIAVCTDLAKQQPDFATDAGARNLLQIDAALLDGAYVSCASARGLPDDCLDHLGAIRKHAFYRYSCFYEHLSGRHV